jgi:hypothetical protein
MSHGHGGHGAADGDNKYIAIFISVLALCLALAETFAKGAQTNSISYNVEASNLWSFYQAKTIRQTTLKTASEQMEIDVGLARDPATKQILEKRVAGWKAEVERYQSEPKPDGKGEGRIELQKRAIEAGKKRDLYMEKYHHYEVASAAFQIAIVLAGTSILVKHAAMVWLAGALAATGVFFTIVGMFFPSAIHLF